MRKITLFVLIAVCAVILLATEPCEGKKKNEDSEVTPAVAEGTDGEKPPGRGRHGRGREGRKEGREPGHRRNRNGKGKNEPKPGDSGSESGPGHKE